MSTSPQPKHPPSLLRGGPQDRPRTGDASASPVEPAGGALHELFAAEAGDLAAAAGFAAVSARLAARGRPIVWIEPDMFEAEAGRLHPPGLIGLGLDPDALALVRTRDVVGALKAADEAARCVGLGAVVTDIWGAPPRLDLTASRRLSLGAKRSGAAVFLLRAPAAAAQSAAFTRWSVRALPSHALAANAPGPPCFALTLTKHRGGAPLRTWDMEWDSDAERFRPRSAAAPAAAALSGPVVPVPADRSLERAGGAWRRAG